MKNMFKTTVLLAGIGGILMLIGRMLFGGVGIYIGLGIGLAFVGFSYWNSDKLAIKAAKARPVTEAEMPEYYAMVRELTTKANMPMPKLYGARLIGDGEPLARALLKLESSAKQIPMDIDQAHAQAYIVNPLSGRKMNFANLFRTHPPTEARVSRLRSRDWS